MGDRSMYRIIEASRGGAALMPQVMLAEYKTMEAVRAYIEQALPAKQLDDFLIEGHGRRIKASQAMAKRKSQ